MIQLTAQSITPYGRAWLHNVSIMRHVRILHVFDRAINLIAGDEVLSLVTPEIGNGPFNVVVNGTQINADDADLKVKSGNRTQINTDNTDFKAKVKIDITPDIIYIGDLVIDVASADLWNPYPDWQQLRAQRARLRAHIPIIREALQRHAPSNSLAQLVADLPAPESGLDLHIVTAARQHWHTLVRGMRDLDRAACVASVRQMVGLGNGLTPAGDDWLLGCALAAHLGLPTSGAAAMLLDSIRLAAPGTTPLSACWLRAAVDGAYGAFWHTFFAGCVQGDSHAVYQAAVQIVQQGHSSGSDAMAGFCAVLGLP